jgi:hypothetical protein
MQKRIKEKIKEKIQGCWIIAATVEGAIRT